LASALPTPALQLDHVDDLSRAAGEDDGLLALRRQARELLSPLVLPSRSLHLWRYSDPAAFLPLADPTASAPMEVPSFDRIDEPLAGVALVAGDALRAVELDPASRRAGVVLEDLHRASTEGMLGTIVPASHGFVEAINSAAWRGGVLLRVPAGVHLEHPIRLRFLAPPAGRVSLPRVLVVAGDGSSFEVIEGHGGGAADASQVLGVSELFLGAAAELRYGLVQRWQPGVLGHLTVRARVDARARLQFVLASFGGSRYKLDIGATLAGEKAELHTYGVAMGGDRQRFDHHTEHIHAAGPTDSDLDFKVAMTGASRSAYTGLIRVAEDAPGCEAYQLNRNLLLSGDARAESIPELEILNEDVRCSHGATVANLDKEQLFYLGSRGLPRTQAVRLIIYGFLGQTLARLPQTTRQRIEAMIAARLHSDHPE
jgi:Fe-S cluster assembly protein SufD